MVGVRHIHLETPYLSDQVSWVSVCSMSEILFYWRAFAWLSFSSAARGGDGGWAGHIPRQFKQQKYQEPSPNSRGKSGRGRVAELKPHSRSTSHFSFGLSQAGKTASLISYKPLCV